MDSGSWGTDEHTFGLINIENKENVKIASISKRKQEYNLSKKPLFPMIPLNLVIDNLHLFLRVGDVLIDALIVDLLKLDSLDKAKKVAGLDHGKHKHVAAIAAYMHVQCTEYTALKSPKQGETTLSSCLQFSMCGYVLGIHASRSPFQSVIMHA